MGAECVEVCVMELTRLLEAVGIADPPQWCTDCWEEADAAFPGEGFAHPALADMAAASTDLDEAFARALRGAIEAVRADERLLRFLWLWHYGFFEKDAEAANCPAATALSDDLAAMLPAAMLVTGLPRVLARHKRLGIPEQVTRDTLYDVTLWSRHYHNVNGRWGFGELAWLRNHFQGRLYRLGRLQFMPAAYGSGYRVYRRKATGHVVAVAESGTRFRRDGLIDGTTGVSDPQAWEAALIEENEHIRGSAVSSEGRATLGRVEIRLSEWDALLKKGTGILDVHIPADGPMDPESCLESYRMANEFFPRHFPEHSYTGFVCTSWLLDPELAKIQPAESNIVRFQREFYLLPALSDDKQTWERVFGSKPDDLAGAPRDTSLRRAILDHYLAGGRMSKGYGFIPADEIGRAHDYFGR